MPTTPARAATPIALLETHFGQPLEHATLAWFDEVPEDGWIDFAKQYLATMQRDFEDEFLAPATERESLRLYFEPRLREAWHRSVAARHQPTPLLGLDPRPTRQAGITRQAVSRLLDPLKKHLLMADAVYIRDSFYYCFDAVADSVKRDRWRDDPNSARLVRDSIRALKDWLPILVELRPFIESGALVFMPYYLSPSFPYDAGAPNIAQHYERLRIRPGGAPKPAPAIDFRAMIEAMRNPQPVTAPAAYHGFSQKEVITAWLNGRILGLDPVFPDKPMHDYAARLYFDDGPETTDVCSDLLSIQVLPFGDAAGINLDTLWAMRKDEEIFAAVQRIVADCKDYIRQNLSEGSTKAAVNDACETFLRDHLDRFERNSKLRFLKYADEKPAVGIGLSVAIGAALLPVSGVAAAIAAVTTPFITPGTARALQNRLSPTRRAYGYLQALL